jgi:two-component system phosphate regulon sensor histidine kinase PhoR
MKISPKDAYRVLATASAGLIVGVGLHAFMGGAAWGPVGFAAAAIAGWGYVRSRRRVLSEHGAAEVVLLPLSPLAQAVLETLPDPLMLVDASERAVFANRAMRGVIGVEIEHKHVSALLRIPDVLEALSRTVASGRPAEVEFSVHVPVERHFRAYTARAGANPPVTALLLHDLTALKRADEMRVDFVANASHELRTPLAAVSGFIETLKGPARDDPEARDNFLEIMQAEADRMRRLIDDLLSLSRIEMNEHVVPQGRVAPETLVQEAAAALAPLAEAEDIRVAVVAEPGLPEVAGDRDELIQLVQNLLHNAIKYGREHGRVTIALRHAPAAGRGAAAMVAIAVKDDGEGIPAEAIPRLTERFYRVDVKRSREKGGTGLGLAIVKHIVARHGGRLSVESRPGEGSTFTVTLPAAKPEAANSAAATVIKP